MASTNSWAAVAGAVVVAMGCGNLQQSVGPPGGASGSTTGSEGGGDGGAGSTGGSTGSTGSIIPSAAGWSFYGPDNGGPQNYFGVTSDQAGNIWVAGGEQGLYLLRPGSTQFQQFTLNDGLHPYGFLPDGTTPARTYLKVISVSGGPPGVVFVGYQGMPPGPGELDCESNWDGPSPDPSIYKSGDADRVTLTGSGISVVHYDISSGPGVVAAEPRGREKVCNVERILYDAVTQSVWFGGNHGFAWGDPSYSGDPTCGGQLTCSGIQEHAHPAINGWSDDSMTSMVLLTEDYDGLAVDAQGDLWAGGQCRSTHFRYATNGKDFWTSESQTEQVANHLDIWPDQVVEPGTPTPDQRVDDDVSGMAVTSDGSVWVSSFTQGVAQLDASGAVVQCISAGLVETPASSIARDPSDDSVWVGGSYFGLSRIHDGQIAVYDDTVFGPQLVNGPVPDIQSDVVGGQRRMLVAFEGSDTPGAIGVYTGP